MRLLISTFLLLSFSIVAPAQLTPEQKVADVNQLAGLFIKNYAPYEWKRDTAGFDLMNLQPWLDRAAKTKDDLEFMDLLVEYVSSLNDAHDVITFPSDFYAYLGFDVDIYEDKLLIDYIDRSMLPSRKYGFVVGDELVSVDGKPAGQVLKEFAKYSIAANPRSTARMAAGWLTFRVQSWIPRAHEIGETAAVVIRRATGAEETYSIPWDKYGTPILQAGPVPGPRIGKNPPAMAGGRTGFDDSLPPYMMSLMPYLKAKAPRPFRAMRGVGETAPLFSMPSGFVQRLGKGFSDYFFSGTFTVDGQKIGYIRIPDFEPASTSAAIRQFETEIRFFEQNTDGLIIDLMRNPGGYVSYVESLTRRVMPDIFRTVGFEIRATSDWVANLSYLLEDALYYGSEDWIITNMQSNLDAVTQANSELRGRTGSVPLNDTGSLLLLPGSTVYTKSLMVLTDEISASGAEAFAAIIQDNKRGTLFGYRTMGAGGTPMTFDATVYTEGLVSVTRALSTRKEPVVTNDFPASLYIENVGVRPDIAADYMTRDNLMKNGKSFVDAFSAAMAEQIKAGKGN